MPCTWSHVGTVDLGHMFFDREATQRRAPVIGNDLNRRGQIERAKLRIGRNGQRHIAAIHIVVAHAKALAAKQKGHTLLVADRAG